MGEKYGKGECVLLGIHADMLQTKFSRTTKHPFVWEINGLGLFLTLLSGLFWTGLSTGSLVAAAAEADLATNRVSDNSAWLTQPISLADAMRITLLRNSSILKAQSDLEAIHGVSVQTRAVALPTLTAQGGYTHDEAVEEKINFGIPGASLFKTPKDQWSGSIRLEQHIYEGGRIRSSLRTARLLRDQALLRYENTVADTLRDVRTAYYDVLQAGQQIVVREASVKLLGQELTNTTQRFDAGTVPRFDVLRGEVEVANARPKLIRAQNAYRNAKTALALVLGYNVPPGTTEDIPLNLTGKLEAESFTMDLATAIAQGMQSRPDLGVARIEESLRKEAVVSAKSGYKPSLLVFGKYGGRNSTFIDDFFEPVSGPGVGVEMRWNIFDGFMTKGKVMEAEAYREKSHFDLEDVTRQVEQQVRKAYSDVVEAREVLASQLKVQEQADEALRLARARYEAGTGTQLDVLNAQTSLTEARTTQIDALHDYAVALARLGRAIGTDVPQKPGAPPSK